MRQRAWIEKQIVAALTRARSLSRDLVVRVVNTPGHCRWCGCTEEHACEGGCSWADVFQTLCSACVGIDKQMRTKAGRRQVAILVQESEGTAP